MASLASTLFRSATRRLSSMMRVGLVEVAGDESVAVAREVLILLAAEDGQGPGRACTQAVAEEHEVEVALLEDRAEEDQWGRELRP